MKIVILTIGTFGDVQPYVALGSGLSRAGYDTYVATHDCFSQFVKSMGLNFLPVAGDPTSWAAGPELGRLTAASNDFFGWMRQLRELAAPLIVNILNSCWQACRSAEAVIYSPLAWAGYSIAEKLEIPAVIACLQPVTVTRDFPAVWAPRSVHLGSGYNKTTHRLVEQAYWQFNRPFINRWRRDTLELPALPFTGPFRRERWQKQVWLYGFSPSILPKPSDWPETAHITGYWLLPENRDFQPEDGLSNFLAGGLPPLYIGFGSMPDPDNHQLREIIIEALQATGQRAVIQGSWAGEMAWPTPVFRTGWIPHRWLFARTAAVIHHGGASTLANGLYAGKPSLIIPYAWDQPFWGEQVALLGAGPQPIPRSRLTTANLTKAIRLCVSDPLLAEAAGQISRVIQGEDGVAAAVVIIKKYLGCA